MRENGSPVNSTRRFQITTAAGQTLDATIAYTVVHGQVITYEVTSLLLNGEEVNENEETVVLVEEWFNTHESELV